MNLMNLFRRAGASPAVPVSSQYLRSEAQVIEDLRRSALGGREGWMTFARNQVPGIIMAGGFGLLSGDPTYAATGLAGGIAGAFAEETLAKMFAGRRGVREYLKRPAGKDITQLHRLRTLSEDEYERALRGRATRKAIELGERSRHFGYPAMGIAADVSASALLQGIATPPPTISAGRGGALNYYQFALDPRVLAESVPYPTLASHQYD